jgi:hypothetical protein
VLVRQCCRARRLDLHDAHLARHAAGDRHGVLRSLRSTSALATTLTLSTVVNCVGIGFQRGTHNRWQIVHNDAAGAPTLINSSAAFALATDAVVTLTVASAPNASSVWVRIVDESSGTLFERELTTNLPANTQFLSPRLYMNNGATASAVAFDCSDVYLDTDY